jgi:hypothetical protein
MGKLRAKNRVDMEYFSKVLTLWAIKHLNLFHASVNTSYGYQSLKCEK